MSYLPQLSYLKEKLVKERGQLLSNIRVKDEMFLSLVRIFSTLVTRQSSHREVISFTKIIAGDG